MDYTLRSVASIRVEEALEDAGRGLEEFKPAQRRVLFEAAKADLNMEHYMNPKFSAWKEYSTADVTNRHYQGGFPKTVRRECVGGRSIR